MHGKYARLGKKPLSDAQKAGIEKRRQIAVEKRNVHAEYERKRRRIGYMCDDLLASLREVMETGDNLTGSGDAVAKFQSAYRKAIKVIQRAEGET